MAETTIQTKEINVLSSSGLLAIIIYFVLIAMMEIVATFIGIVTGVIGHAILLFFMINHAVRTEDTTSGRVILIQSLIPLMRFLSVTMPIQQFPVIAWYPLISSPLLVALYLSARYLKLTSADLGLVKGNVGVQTRVALVGFPMGLVGYLLLRPEPILETLDTTQWIVAFIILSVFVAFTEELLFRGLLLKVTTTEIQKGFGLFTSCAMYFFMYVSSGSLAFSIFMGFVGIFFSWSVINSKGIWGAVVGHMLLVGGMALIWPYLFT